MIVKVQLSLMTSEAEQQMLVYNKDRTIWWEGPATAIVRLAMQGDAKAFFEAELVGTEVQIGERVKDPGW